MIPSTPISVSLAMRARVVDGPHVELAAALVHGAHERACDYPPVGHDRVVATLAQPGPGTRGKHRAVAGEDRQRRDRREHVGRVVAAHARHRPAEAQPRLLRADAREHLREHAAEQACARSGRTCAAPRARAARSREASRRRRSSSAGEALAREVLERLLEAQRLARADVLVVVRDEQLAAAVGALAEARRARSCPRRGAAPRRSSRACCPARCGRALVPHAARTGAAVGRGRNRCRGGLAHRAHLCRSGRCR